jgi:hypothetical protein
VRLAPTSLPTPGNDLLAVRAPLLFLPKDDFGLSTLRSHGLEFRDAGPIFLGIVE